MRLRFLLALVLASAMAAAARAGEPFYVDLSAAANTAPEDDGIADNGQGGWSDEGINDMFVFPPVATGTFTRCGYRFRVLDPAANGGRALVMLRGEKRGRDKPESVTLPVPSVRGRYLYILQSAVGSVAGQPNAYTAAVYTVTYADGATREIPIRDGVELHAWWTGQWWDNSGRAAWPLFMGRNLYTMKWNRFIGLWATQWENPVPDQPIAGLALRSAGKTAPVVWAVTLADEDFYEPESRRKESFARPADAPAGYFAAKVAVERRAIYVAAVRHGLLTGVRRVEVIAPDLLAVTVDSALGGIGAGDGAGLIEALQKPETFTVFCDRDPTWARGVAPTKVGRHTFECWRGDIGAFPANTLFLHVFYLRLPAPLMSGRTYRVAVQGLSEPFAAEATLAYNEERTVTPVIKINGGGYALKPGRRIAYLGWWAGDLGKVDYAALGVFTVVDETTGQIALTGHPALRRADDPLSGEDVYELDLSPLRQAGRYHVRVPGLGRSDTFALGPPAARELYRDTLRAFYHQRCGEELRKPFATFARPACHLQVYASGHLVGNPGYAPQPGEAVRTYRGGYHDAADCDVFTYHLRATAQVLAAYEQAPRLFRDGDLNLPESGNGIPDVLDEADWALFFYRDHQQADGGVPLGRGNDEDFIRDWERDHKSRPPFGIFPPRNTSSSEFAAVAAQYARLVRPFDAARADGYVAAADKAYRWARANPTKPEPERGEALFLAWAAAELYSTTGLAPYQEDFLRDHRTGALTRAHWQLDAFVPLCAWPYAVCRQPGADKTVQGELRQALLRRADGVVANTATNAYRWGHDGKRALGWGNGNGGGHYADVCLRAYWLTGETKYLETASLNADFQLGGNPLSKSFVTGIGPRHPNQPQINAALYTQPGKSGDTVRGITVYGLANGPPPGYPAEVPLYRRWRDIGTGAEVCSEFTITETLGASAMLYSALYAIDTP